MIVYGAIMPHTPLLLPSIGGDVESALKKIKDSCQEIADEIYARHIDTIVIIADQPTMHTDALAMNIKDPFTFDLTEFGDFGFDVPVRPDILLIDRMQRQLRKDGFKISLNTDNNLSFSTAVPLSFFTKLFPETKVIVMSPPTDGKARSIFQFGTKIQDLLQQSNKKIAIITTGDLSHSLTENSPQDYHIDGEKFDKRVLESIQSTNIAGLLSIEESVLENANQSIYSELLLLFGILDKIAIEAEHINYHSPLGVGYLTAGFAPH